MRIIVAARLLALAAALPALAACFGANGAPEQSLPLVTSVADSQVPDPAAGLSREEARAQAIAEIRAKAQAHERQHSEAPYPNVFARQGPPLAIAHQQKSQAALAAELGRVRSELEAASDPDEVAELEARMAALQELGRTHAQNSEERIREISESSR